MGVSTLPCEQNVVNHCKHFKLETTGLAVVHIYAQLQLLDLSLFHFIFHWFALNVERAALPIFSNVPKNVCIVGESNRKRTIFEVDCECCSLFVGEYLNFLALTRRAVAMRVQLFG